MRQEPLEAKDENDDDDGGKNAFGYHNIEKVLMIFAYVESKSRLKVIN